MSEFRRIMMELKTEKEFFIFVGWIEQAKATNSQMVQLIHENTQKIRIV